MAANTRVLRKRLKAIKNTIQITKTMSMIAASKMRRAQAKALSGQPYQKLLENTIARLAKNAQLQHQLLVSNKSEKHAVLLLTTNKGLCGSLNTNLFRFVNLSKEKLGENEVAYYTIGKKGRDFVAKTGRSLDADFPYNEEISFNDTVGVTKFFMDEFKSGKIGSVSIVYPSFVSTLTQLPQIKQILPVSPVIEEEIKDNEEFVFEPNASTLLEYLLTHFAETQVYQALLETRACEHSARMIAMQNANDNAKELHGDITLMYNQLRQEAITKEILEISSATAALQY